MAGNNSPIELVDAPDCRVLMLDNCTETPNGSFDDDDVNLFVMIRILFKSSDRLGRLVCQCYRVPISRFTEELIVAEMLGKGRILKAIITENPSSFASFAKEILLTGQYMACHRAPERTLLCLLAEAFLPVNRLPNGDDFMDGDASESGFRVLIYVRDRYGDNDEIDAYDDVDNDNSNDYDDEIDDDDDDDDDETDDDDEDNENATGFLPASEESIKGLEKVRVKNEPGFNRECSVCLEELEVASEATQLPCSHLFHGDCILKWLTTSRFCPLCRFELPS